MAQEPQADHGCEEQSPSTAMCDERNRVKQSCDALGNCATYMYEFGFTLFIVAIFDQEGYETLRQ